VRDRGYHIAQSIGSQMAGMLLALHAERALPTEIFLLHLNWKPRLTIFQTNTCLDYNKITKERKCRKTQK
jgi:hypothetical protein